MNDVKAIKLKSDFIFLVMWNGTRSLTDFADACEQIQYYQLTNKPNKPLLLLLLLSLLHV